MAEKEEKDVKPPEEEHFSVIQALFDKDLKLILEKIFFPLDNESFKKCLEVCLSWQRFLTSEEFQKRRSDFSQRLWMDTENLKHQVRTHFNKGLLNEVSATRA